ncbi:Uncharacterized protein NEOC65_001176 [Neochlamydia sp. AcF65]|uniref:hypothetical protein n=1 Tax=Neochlamydia sp. AcF65 TaxID=2795735 RepID=UPI001BC9CA1B|nr:hypothetical protein [Neochlamydia sp. AcF65]MBS4166096.1 Uncharacterized protein [Neochlamydia sp. AcF65]
MSFSSTFPVTNKSLKPFRNDFGERVPSTYKQANWKGRLYCCIQLACSPLTVPLKIVKRAGNVAGAAMLLMKMLIKDGEEFFKVKPVLKWKAELAIMPVFRDYLLALALCPITIGASRIRYLVGIIDPAKAFPTK